MTDVEVPESLVHCLGVVDGGAALVIGCHDHMLLSALTEAGCEVVGIDDRAAVLAAAAEAFPEAAFVEASPSDAPLDVEIADVVLRCGEADAELVARLKAAVRPGGLAGFELPRNFVGVPGEWFRGWDVLHEGATDDGYLVMARRPTVEILVYDMEDEVPPPVLLAGPGGLPWHAVASHQACAIGSPRYVPRPTGSGTQLARMLQRGLGPVLVSGPAGFGKTSELHRAADDLAAAHAVYVLDLEALGAATLEPADLVYEVGRELVERWVARDLEILPGKLLIKDVRASDPRFPQGDGKASPPDVIARRVVVELAEAHGQGALVLLFDGLNRLAAEIARPHVEALLALRGHAHVAVVGGSGLVLGPANDVVLSNYRLFSLPTLDADDPACQKFARDVLAHRLGLDALPPAIDAAATAALGRSGGVLRQFLELMEGAAAYTDDLDGLGEALSAAVRDRGTVLRRQLAPGDLTVLAEADGTAGYEIPLDRRERLLERGLLLERVGEDDAYVTVHPLLAGTVRRHRAGESTRG